MAINIDDLLATISSSTGVRNYALKPGQFTAISDILNGEMLCCLARQCSQQQQDLFFKSVHPFELGKMSQVKGRSAGPLSHWDRLKPARFAYWGHCWENQPSKEDFLDRLTGSAHFFLLFEYFRSKEERQQCSIQHEAKLNEFMNILHAVQHADILPSLQYFFSVKEGEYISLRAPLIDHYNRDKEGMQIKANEFLSFIETDDQIKDNAFAKKFLKNLESYEKKMTSIEMKTFKITS